ncbi:hypothetical protein AWM70_16890 [Paenibacillus yonginensis]|uniref:Glycosyl transferase family 1 domain-containing protein n=1 Tax=Paenibacillus yonginensis TaxID=1462996 RepID=A0A1B1N3Q6_9BACL|nr:glycosyltransferase [Paenibacillus yonginensis]ANS76049.1 hypothetical protein AWM70_16890 [Paenibacillus yonginensis]
MLLQVDRFQTFPDIPRQNVACTGSDQDYGNDSDAYDGNDRQPQAGQFAFGPTLQAIFQLRCNVTLDQPYKQRSDYVLNKLKKRMIYKTELKIIKAAHKCFASSVYLKSNLIKLGKEKVELIENGVDFSLFGNIAKDTEESSERPVLGFIGGLKPWKIDFNLLHECAKRKPEWDIMLIGPSYGEISIVYQDLLNLPNVKILSEIPLEKVAEYIASFDVGLLPYLNNKYNQGVFPLKFFEYLAGGLPVVGCGLPSTIHYVEKHIYEYSENNIDFFIEACQRAVEDRRVSIDRRKSLARSADWNQKFELIWNNVKST